jgi:hypothetical protein
MRREFKVEWLLAGLAMIGMMLVGESEARAGSTGIVITKGSTPSVGDPHYEYLFDIQLLPGSTLDPGGYITIYDLPEIDQFSLTGQPSASWGSSLQLLGRTPAGVTITDSPSIWNVTWQWNGAAISAPSNANLDLGNFAVGPIDQPVSPLLLYVGSLDGTNPTTPGQIQVNAIPEPSSVILMLTAAGLLPLYARIKRRRPAVQKA